MVKEILENHTLPYKHPMFILAKSNNKLQGMNGPKQSLTLQAHLS